MDIRDYIEFLGSDSEGKRYFLNKRGVSGGEGDHIVLCKTVKDLGNKTELFELAPREFWIQAYPLKNSKGELTDRLDLEAASADMISLSGASQAGMYSVDKIRGRGVWKEGSGYLMHLGDSLLVDGNYKQFNEVGSGYVYPRLEKIELASTKELNHHQTAKIIEASKLFDWKDTELAPILFAGWCALAPICGGLDWRPHLWLNAPAGAGKSTLMSIAADLTANFHLVLQSASDTTVNGLRQSIGSDAMPVLFDEVEGDRAEAHRKIQDLLALIRIASTESEGGIRKGTPSQKAVVFKIRNMFMLASINNSLKQEQDKQRFIQLLLNRPPERGTPEAEQRERNWQKLKEKRVHFSMSYAAGLLLRSARLLPIIRHNIDILTPILNSEFGNMRKALSYATLFAGYISLLHDRKIDEKEATVFVNQFELGKQVESEEETGAEVALFNHLMQSLIDMEMFNGERTKKTIGETVALALADNQSAKDWLGRYGITVDGLKQEVFIANNHPFLEKIFLNTAGAAGWGQILRHIEGAKNVIKRLPGLSSPVRGWSIPYAEPRNYVIEDGAPF